MLNVFFLIYNYKKEKSVIIDIIFIFKPVKFKWEIKFKDYAAVFKIVIVPRILYLQCPKN